MISYLKITELPKKISLIEEKALTVGRHKAMIMDAYLMVMGEFHGVPIHSAFIEYKGMREQLRITQEFALDDEGYRKLENIMKACGIGEMEDISDLIAKIVSIGVSSATDGNFVSRVESYVFFDDSVNEGNLRLPF